ncbi:hypothetical protein DVH05_006792 [Phytophthora capsici]|nr:hypothetical protein DVH05_006792 [Phytophthora capsici]
MSFKDGISYGSDHTFTTEALLQITPSDVCRWMNKRAYGDSDPTDDMKPVHARSSTLEFAKKAVSSFMPRVNTSWDPVTEQGNPTRSDAVNKLIKRVKRSEVRREGVGSNARRAIEFDEFLSLLTLARAEEERVAAKYMVNSVLTLQWHIMARIDDMMKLQFNNFFSNTQYTSTLLCQVRWSKNISEERDAPEQIVFGSMDSRLCPLLNLAIHIETSPNVTSSEFIFGNSKDGDRVVRRFLEEIYKKPAFEKLKEGKLGTHSLRKGAATYCSRSGVSKDYVNRRGRWRTRKAVVDVYIDNTQPYPDACAAAVLSGPAGPCFYKLKQGIQCVEPSLLLNDVAPTVKAMMGESIAKTLALPLLWAALESTDNISDLLPCALQQRIIEAYKKTGGNPELNPVDREAFYVLGDGSQLNLVVINEGEVVEMNETRTSLTATVSGGGGEGVRREFAALHSQLLTSRRYMTELMNEVLHSRRESQREMEKVTAILRRVAACPIPRVQTGNFSRHKRKAMEISTGQSIDLL